jgi:hypothetical protein
MSCGAFDLTEQRRLSLPKFFVEIFRTRSTIRHT